MGLSQPEIDEALAAQSSNDQDDIEIQPGNWLTVALFFTVCRYWVRAGMEGRPVHLDPLRVEARANKLVWYKSLDDESMERLWAGLEVMELACLSAWREKKD